MVLEELRNSWTEMFTHIDELIERVVTKYPEFSKEIKRDIIHDAVRKTQKLDELLTDAKNVSKKNQETLFNDNN
tara:strand:+ start:366 stop:587 length:222 start_codon:yes stop_codon:yes gene_type:complete